MGSVTLLLGTVLWLTACGSGSDLTGPDLPFQPSIDPGRAASKVPILEAAERIGDRVQVHSTQVLPLEGGFSGINPCTGEETVINGQIIIRTNASGDDGGLFHVEETMLRQTVTPNGVAVDFAKESVQCRG